jgi:hypothetical protein
MGQQALDGFLKCPICDTVRLVIPNDRDGAAIVRCATCNTPVGTWQAVRHEFITRLGNGVFAIEDGQFFRR